MMRRNEPEGEVQPKIDERTLSTEKTIAPTPVLELVERDGWSYVRRPKDVGVAAIIAVTEQGELVLTEQFRKPVQRSVIDLPAGLSEGREVSSLVESAARELEEETGFLADSYTKLFERPTSPGLSDEVVTFVHAKGLIRSHGGGGLESEGESIEVHLVPLDSILDWLQQQEAVGALIDPKVDVALRVLTAGA